ncbi:MAG: hypothetical protein WC551_02225 [Patescibacteria group bacterium]
MKRDEVGFAIIYALLGALVVAYLAVDIWQVSTGSVDLNRHLPFFMPVVLSVFIFITMAIRKHGRQEPENKV